MGFHFRDSPSTHALTTTKGDPFLPNEVSRFDINFSYVRSVFPSTSNAEHTDIVCPREGGCSQLLELMVYIMFVRRCDSEGVVQVSRNWVVEDGHTPEVREQL